MKLITRQLITLCIMCGIHAQAQEIKIAFTKQISVKNDITDFHRYGDHLYSSHTDLTNRYVKIVPGLKGFGYGIILTKYTKDLKEQKVLSIDEGKKNLAPLKHSVHYGEKYIYVIYFKKEEDGNLKMYITIVDPEDLSVKANKEIMEFTQNNQDFWKGMKELEEIQSFYTISKDGKKAWIVNVSPTQMLSTVIDGDLNILQKTDQTPVNLNKLLITAAHIDNDGNKVMAYRYDNPALKSFWSRGLFFQPANKKGEFKAVNTPNGSYPGNLAIHPSMDGSKLYIGGEYFGQEYVNGGQGVLLAEVDLASKSVSSFAQYPYTEELRNRLKDLNFATNSKGKIVFRDKSLDYRIAVMANGTVILSADMYTSDFGTQGFPFNGPIIHLFLTPNGSTTWNLVPKVGVRSPVTAYLNYIIDNKLICIYADNPKNQGNEVKDINIKKSGSERETIPVANIYDSDGKLLSKKILMDHEDDLDGNILISIGSKIEDRKLLFPIGKIKMVMGKYHIDIEHLCYIEIL